MKVRIQYCRPCGYRRHAERLANAVKRRLTDQVELIPGNFGIYKVWCDERLVFDKRTTRGWLGKIGLGLIPADEELLELLEKSRS